MMTKSRITKEELSTLISGMKVKSDFFHDEKDLVRTITAINVNAFCSSGMMVWLNAGEPCKCCGKYPGKSIDGVDAAWITFIYEETEHG